MHDHKMHDHNMVVNALAAGNRGFGLLHQGLVFAVVLDIIHLLLVALDQRFGVLYAGGLRPKFVLELLDLRFQALDAGIEAHDIVLQVADFHRQLPFQDFDLVDLAIDALKMVKVLHLLFHRFLLLRHALSDYV